MRDHSRDNSATPLLNWVAYSSVAAIGVAAIVSGIVISGVSLYRNLTSGVSRQPDPTEPQIAESVDLESNNLACFKESHSAISANGSVSDTDIRSLQPNERLDIESAELKNTITSFGERTLIQEEASIAQQIENRSDKLKNFGTAKKQGTEQYAVGQYQDAVSNFKAARDIYKNSPESLIYLNNALANQAGKSYALAVTIPLKNGQQDNDLRTSMAVLKGVAHAQDEINKAGGIQGVPLQILIVDDFDNSPKSAEAVAQILAKNQSVLGVVGHDASKATLAARKVYESSQLVSISPTSTSAVLPPGHTFAFRTVPNDIAVVEKIADYLLDHNRKKIAVFYEEDTEIVSTSYSEPVKESFEAFVNNNIPNGQVVKEFNLADLDSDKRESFISSLKQLTIAGAIDTIMLVPSQSDASVLRALETATLSRQLSETLLIIGNDAMYDSRISQCGDTFAKMVAVSFWDMNFARTNISSIPLQFVRRASSSAEQTNNSLWDTNDIHWISAMAYDATMAFGKALRENHPSPTRTNIATSLSSARFSIDGATGIVKFDNNGDRIGTARLVKLLPTNAINQEDAQYDFQPIFSE